MSKTNSLNQLLGATKTVGSNIGKSKALAGRGEDTHFVFSQLGKSRLGVVETNNRLKIDQTGDIVGTGIDGDFAISGGTGMVVVQDSSGGRSFTNVTSFRINENGDLENDASKLLSAWKLDPQGNRPSDFSFTSSLSKVNLFGFNSKPTATDKVTVQMNVDTALKKLKGPGEVFRVNQGGINAGIKETDIILPESIPSGGIQQGDQFLLTSTPPALQRTFVFGGLAISKKISENGGFYGVTEPERIFNFGAGPNLIPSGSGINISVGGTVTRLTAKQNPNSGLGEFDSLFSLKDAINKVPGLTTIIKDKRLVIASTDGNKAINFNDFGASNLSDTLGLIDVPQNNTAGGIFRFATMKSLKDQINLNNELTGLEATTVAGGVDVHSLLATSGFGIRGNSMGMNTFTRAVRNAAGSIQGKATVSIESPKHGLNSGDYVRVTGTGLAEAPDGFYMVSATNADRFNVHLPDVAANVNALGNVAANLPVAANATWQKIAGKHFDVATTTAAAAVGGGNVTLTIPVANIFGGAGAGPDAINQNDVVYISGIGGAHINAENVDVPDGYYVVQAVNGGAGTFAIIPVLTATAAADATHPNVVVGNGRVQKVGASNAGAYIAGTNFNASVMQTVNASNLVTLFLPGNNYAINDQIGFDGLPIPTVVNLIPLENANTKQYKIVARTADSVTFEVVDNLGAPINSNANAFVGYTAGANQLVPGFRVNNFTRTFEYMGLDQEKFDFTPTYNPGDSALGISRAGNHPAGSIFSHAFSVVDSLGETHEMILRFAKLNNKLWAVELGGIPNENGEYDFVVARPDGVVKTGSLEFDASGSLLSPGDLAAPVSVSWKNGSNASNVTFDWGTIGGAAAGGAGARDGITQVRAPSAPGLGFKANGNTAGSLTGFSITPDGSVVLSFSNGEVLTPYQIAVATAPNINGLQPGDGGTYTETKASGKMVLGIAGQVGIPELIPRSIELSNIDTTKELLDVKDLGDAVQAVARVLNADHLNFKTILSETQN